MKKIFILLTVISSFAATTYSQEKQDSLKTQNKSKATYQIGLVKITVWENQRHGEFGEFIEKTFKIEKLYKKGGEWKSTNQYDLTELLQLRAALDKAIMEEGVKVKEGKGEK
ncbi:MAG TPA: hypothetical protein VIH57_12825 [Bacteroidales bacterium]